MTDDEAETQRLYDQLEEWHKLLDRRTLTFVDIRNALEAMMYNLHDPQRLRFVTELLGPRIETLDRTLMQCCVIIDRV